MRLHGQSHFGGGLRVVRARSRNAGDNHIGVTDRFDLLQAKAFDWYDVWLGAAITAILFELGKSAIGLYIGKQGLESTYGAAASIIVLLIWVYYSSHALTPLQDIKARSRFARKPGSPANKVERRFTKTNRAHFLMERPGFSRSKTRNLWLERHVCFVSVGDDRHLP